MTTEDLVTVRKADLLRWREEWLEANDPKDGTDCVTPFDAYLYGTADVADVAMLEIEIRSLRHELDVQTARAREAEDARSAR